MDQAKPQVGFLDFYKVKIPTPSRVFCGRVGLRKGPMGTDGTFPVFQEDTAVAVSG